MNKSLPLIAALLSLIAISISLMGRSDSRPNAAGAPSPSPDLERQLGRIDAELREASETIADLRTRIGELEARPARSSKTASPDTALEQRLASLEEQQQELKKFNREFDQYGIVSSMEVELVNAYSTLMDTNQPTSNRLKQVGQLKRYRHFDEKALIAVADIYAQTDDFGQKGQALAAMKGTVVTPEFRNQILADLSADVQAGNQSARFRYYAIEALEPMRAEPAVQEWLTHLARNDPEAKLADRAGQALGNNTEKPAR